MVDVPDRFDPEKIAADLRRCRRRGLEGLDRAAGNQKPVEARELQRLAEAHAAAISSPDRHRTAQIKTLLLAGIEALRRQERLHEAELIRDLYLGESMNGPIGAPGELLRNARRKAVDMSDSRFDEIRRNALDSFANVLITHVSGLAGPPADELSDDQDQTATIGLADDVEHFVELLATAAKVTIIGITNEDLLPMLERALRLKRAASGRDDAFWDSLRIVFQSTELLASVDDERLRLSDPAEALRQRREAAIWARRLIRVFLKRTGSTKWALYESLHQPLPTGTALEFAGGRKTARLLLRMPGRATQEQVYIDTPDPKGLVGLVFDEIVHRSKFDDMIVPVGEPVGDSAFRCNGSRVQSEALKNDSRATGWLPMVLVVTFRRYRGHVEPVLQLRTRENSAREESRLSHISSHILEKDRRNPAGREVAQPPTLFDLTHEVPVSAAQRVFREITGELAPTAELIPVTASGYLYPDKESLFFFVYAFTLPEALQFPQSAELRPAGLAQLLAIRANQAFRSAADLCRSNEVKADAWADAARIAALNLRLHDRGELADALMATEHFSHADRAELAASLDDLVREVTATSRASTSREVTLEGLAGWQYRNFFSDLLPSYAKADVDGAADLLQSVTADPVKDAARHELADLYQDEQVMQGLPMEL